MGQSRQPLSPKEKCDLNAVRQTLHCILSEHGFVAEIEGAVGCEPLGQDGSPSEAEIQAIVAEVVRQMRTNR